MNGTSIIDSGLKEKALVEAALIQNRKQFLSFLHQRAGSLECVEDIFQEFCLRALTNSATLRNPERVVAWLYRILNSTSADFFRSENRRQRNESEYTQLQTEQGGTKANDPEKICTCFTKLLPALKPEYSHMLEQIDLRGEPRDEVAKNLGITTNLARVRLHRARQALKSALRNSCQDCCHEEGFMDCNCVGGKEAHGTCFHPTNCNAAGQFPS
ncbi:MAG: sigma-70 family RNA polymerase sigma factor [Nitrospira sp.]|nr:sigma-70 family RNA polymerase sigma factor [Nitrospira sp.]